MRWAWAIVFLAGCQSAPTLVATVTEPEPFTLSLEKGSFASATDLYGLYGPTHALFVYIATDRRSDNMPNPAPQRLGVVIPMGDTVQPIDATSIGGLELRDLDIAVDCNHFSGTETWISQGRAWHFTVDATCVDDPAVHVQADCQGDL
jgi:hypothetical protein